MYTSYFAKYKGNNGVVISLYTPSWLTIPHRNCELLAPSSELLESFKNGEINEEQYTVWYYELLDDRKLTVDKVLTDLGNDAVLLCYEKPPKFCHRHLVSKWFLDFNINVKEI